MMAALVAMALTSEATGAACAETVPMARLLSQIEAAEQRYASLEAAAFVDAVDLVVLDLPCVEEIVPPPVAARYHVLMGLRWYVQGDEAQSRASFAAARSADPALAVSPSLVPEGHELRGWLQTARADATVPVPKPISGALLFDGKPTTERPMERPSILQVADGAEQVSVTCYLLPGDALPTYPALPDPRLDQRRERPRPERKRGWGWLAAGGAGAVSSLVLYGLAAQEAARFAGPLPDEVGRPELLALRTRTNLLVAGSLLTGGVGAVGIAGFAARW